MKTEIELVNFEDKSSDDLFGDIFGGYLPPMELVKDPVMAKKIQKAIELVEEYAAELEDKIEIC